MGDQAQSTLLDALATALERAGAYNRGDQTPPAALLWPDGERQWEPLLPALRARMPQLLTLGAYAPAQRRGPAYWVRCAVARALPEIDFPAETVPIVYLPGVSKQELRTVEECPRPLQPIAELQYRGALWTHRNGKDWTVSSFLQAREGGLAIEVAPDQATREALRRALPRLASEPLERLRREAPLRAALLDSLLNPDEVGRLLQWLDDPESYQGASEPAAWAAFCALCRRAYGFSPEADGPISAARLLAGQAGRWASVWQRFVEAPARYPHLPDLLARARPPEQLSLFDDQQVWPQINSDAEARLRRSLNEMRAGYALEARSAIAQLEAEHGLRRAWVWARLDQSPMATALAHLAALAEATAQPLAGGSLADLATSYAEQGWRADAELVAALAAVERREDVEAVTAAAVTIYRPWLEHIATLWQQRYQEQPPVATAPPEVMMPGTCILFCDALRLDLGQRLIKLLAQGSSVATLTWRLAALPTITPTAKPAAAPVADRCTGSGATGLTPIIAAGGQRVSAETLRRSLEGAGYQILSGDETGDPSGRAWTEAGAIDSYGHEHARRLAHHLADELRAIARRIEWLLDAGWRQIIVTTDHGWLLLPGGLPRADLPEHLTELRKGRCARLKPLAETTYPTLPWHWDANVRIAMAPGICCFEAGKEYEHGGLSPQECVVPLISVRRTGTTVIPSISAVAWHSTGQRGLVCQYDVVCFDEISGISFDQKDGVNIMKGYMESGEFSRGRESIRASGSLVLVGNFDVDVEHQQRVGHLFGPLPVEMRNDTAFMDRIHAYLPGWDVPKLDRSLLTEHFGLVSDFLAECFSQLRGENRLQALPLAASAPTRMTGRTKKTFWRRRGIIPARTSELLPAPEGAGSSTSRRASSRWYSFSRSRSRPKKRDSSASSKARGPT